MAESVTKLKVFISGPGDTLREQQLVARTIKSMNQSQMKHTGITLQGLSWREDLRADFGIYAQDVVNKQFGTSWDVYVGILWARHGTPTPKAGSGTEEEFDLAFQRWRADNNSCKVAVFFCDAFLPPSVDVEQLRKVQAFRQKVESLGGVYTTFADGEDFVFKIRDYLSDAVASYGREWGEAPLRLNNNPLPTLGFYKDVLQAVTASMPAFVNFFQTLSFNLTEVRKITTDMRVRMNEFPESLTEPAGRKWVVETKRELSKTFATGGANIDANLPKIREAWGNLSAILFGLVLHPELHRALTSDSAQKLASQIAQLAPQINEARKPLVSMIGTFSTTTFVTGLSRRKLVKTLQEVDREYAFMADECKDLSTLFQRKVRALL